MGFPVTERGGPPGGGGIGRPVALLGACAGAEGGGVGAAGALAAGGADPDAAAGAGGAAGADAAAGTDGAAGADGVAGADGAATAGAGEGGGTEPVGGAGLTALAAGARSGVGALGCSDAGRLVINLAPERLGGIGGGGLWVVSFAVLSPTEVPPLVSPPTGTGALGVSIDAGTVSSLAAAFLVVDAFLSEGAGSSGWTGRRSPSRSALRRARSACASSMDDEWLLTPIPRDRHRSSASLLVSPSSCASS
jgi:hypothetical protein